MRRGGDPYWLRVKYPAECSGCHKPIVRGDEAFYYPNGRTMLCNRETCGKQASREFEAARADEAHVNGGY